MEDRLKELRLRVRALRRELDLTWERVSEITGYSKSYCKSMAGGYEDPRWTITETGKAHTLGLMIAELETYKDRHDL